MTQIGRSYAAHYFGLVELILQIDRSYAVNDISFLNF